MIIMWKCPKCGRSFEKAEQSHYCGEKPRTVDEYIIRQDEDKQSDLQLVRRALRSALPEAEERISWSMPTYWKKHNIIHFAASKKRNWDDWERSRDHAAQTVQKKHPFCTSHMGGAKWVSLLYNDKIMNYDGRWNR